MKTSKPFKLRSQGLPFKEMGSSPINKGCLKYSSSPLNEGFGVLQADANKEQAFNTRLDLDKKVESNVTTNKESQESGNESWWGSMKNKAKEAYDNIDVNKSLDNLQTGLTAAGMVPGVGNAVDFLNAGISTSRAAHAKYTGDDEKAKQYLKEGAENLAFAIPGAGTVGAGAKLTKKSIEAAKGADNLADAKKTIDKAKQTKKTVKKVSEGADVAAGGTQLASNDNEKKKENKSNNNKTKSNNNKPKDNKPKEKKKVEKPKIAKVKTPKKKDRLYVCKFKK